MVYENKNINKVTLIDRVKDDFYSYSISYLLNSFPFLMSGVPSFILIVIQVENPVIYLVG